MQTPHPAGCPRLRGVKGRGGMSVPALALAPVLIDPRTGTGANVPDPRTTNCSTAPPATTTTPGSPGPPPPAAASAPSGSHGTIRDLDPATGEIVRTLDTDTLPGQGDLHPVRGPPRLGLPGLRRDLPPRHLPAHPRRAHRRQRHPRHGARASVRVRHLHRALASARAHPPHRRPAAGPPVPAPPRSHAAARTAAHLLRPAPQRRPTPRSAGRCARTATTTPPPWCGTPARPELWRRSPPPAPPAGPPRRDAQQAAAGPGQVRTPRWPSTRPAAWSTSTPSSASTPPATTPAARPPACTAAPAADAIARPPPPSDLRPPAAGPIAGPALAACGLGEPRSTPGRSAVPAPGGAWTATSRWRTTSPSTPPRPPRPRPARTGRIRSPAAIDALRCAAHHRLIATAGSSASGPAADSCALTAWAHMLGYRRPLPHQIPPLLHHLRAAARRPHRLPPRPAPPGRRDRPLGRDLDETAVLVVATWTYAGTGQAHHRRRHLALAAAARAREHRPGRPRRLARRTCSREGGLAGGQDSADRSGGRRRAGDISQQAVRAARGWLDPIGSHRRFSPRPGRGARSLRRWLARSGGVR